MNLSPQATNYVNFSIRYNLQSNLNYKTPPNSDRLSNGHHFKSPFGTFIT
jgi:hypothetical protein